MILHMAVVQQHTLLLQALVHRNMGMDDAPVLYLWARRGHKPCTVACGHPWGTRARAMFVRWVD